MARIEKTVFISYRRTNLPWALCIYQNLTQNGYDVFFDYQSIDSGSFETAILDNIRARAHFVLILTPSALERCKNPNDWLRREIETAIDEKRNIVPLMLEGFDFGSTLIQEVLTGKLSVISSINALPVHGAYVFEALERLRTRFLNVALEDINLPTLQAEAEKITETQQTAASQAAPVGEDQLTAQTWFERGIIFQQDNNLEEAFRCYSEAIKLDFNLDAALNNLGIILEEMKRYEEAESTFRKAIDINPSSDTYYNLGNLLHNLKRFEEAEVVYREAIKINSIFQEAYYNLGNTLKVQKRFEEAENSFRKAIELNPYDDKSYNNLGLLLFENLKRFEEAETIFNKSIDINPSGHKAYFNLGNLLYILKRFNEAEKEYRKSIKMNSSYYKAYNNLGVLLKNMERLDEAEIAYKKAAELDPSDLAFYNLGILLEQKKDYLSAINYYEKYLEVGGGIKNGDQKAVEEKIKSLKLKLTKKKPVKKAKKK